MYNCTGPDWSCFRSSRTSQPRCRPRPEREVDWLMLMRPLERTTEGWSCPSGMSLRRSCLASRSWQQPVLAHCLEHGCDVSGCTGRTWQCCLGGHLRLRNSAYQAMGGDWGAAVVAWAAFGPRAVGARAPPAAAASPWNLCATYCLYLLATWSVSGRCWCLCVLARDRRRRIGGVGCLLEDLCTRRS